MVAIELLPTINTNFEDETEVRLSPRSCDIMRLRLLLL
jgi:hypothetical protein